MKKLKLLLFSAIIAVSSLALAQTTPPVKTRSDGTFQQLDQYLIALKRFGIPTSATDNLNADFTGENTRKLLYNTTLAKLRVYNPAAGTWADAVTVDIASIPGLQAALDAKANDNVVVKLTGDQLIYGEKTFADVLAANNANIGVLTVNSDTYLDGNATVLGTLTAELSGNAATVTTINGKIQQGSNVTITGAGTTASPYVINSSAGGGGVGSLQTVTDNGSTTTHNITAPNFIGDLTGSATKWNSLTFTDSQELSPTYFMTTIGGGNWKYSANSVVKTALATSLQDVTTVNPVTDQNIVITGAGTKLQIGEAASVGNWKRLQVSTDPDNNLISLQGVQSGVGYNQRVVLQPMGGNVGIGKTPVEALDVNGNSIISGTLGVNGNIAGGANVSVAGSLDILGSGELNCDPTANFGSDVFIQGNLTVSDGVQAENLIVNASITAANAQISTAPVSPTDVVRLQDLQQSSTVSSATSLSMTLGGYYQFRGSAVSTWTFPSSPTVGTRYYVMNKGTETLYLNGNGNDFYMSGMTSATLQLDPTEVCHVWYDGTNWFKIL